MRINGRMAVLLYGFEFSHFQPYNYNPLTIKK